MKNNILHITPHLGGGVGTVLLNWLIYDKSNCHSIITLDYANENGTRILKENNIKLFSQIPTEQILSEIEQADITVIHFWNHPLLYDFLVRNKLPKSRIIIWSHVLGAKPPYVFNEKLFDFCDKFVFTTPVSYNFYNRNPKFDCILSTGGIERFKDIKPVKHDKYTVGYIGTVDYAKMHPEYINILSKTKAEKIFVVGGDNEEQICKDADERFAVTGKLSDISSVLEQIDVFAYLLNPNHYGTAEQVLQEAMSAGIPPVVLNNPCEASLVKHLETGLIANNLEEYVDYINLLKEDINLRYKLGNNAKTYAIENFSLEKLTFDWNSIFKQIMELPKTCRSWEINKTSLTSYDIFLESLGKDRSLFENKSDNEIKELLKEPSWSSDTKGTPKQYFNFLGGNELKHICSLY